MAFQAGSSPVSLVSSEKQNKNESSDSAIKIVRKVRQGEHSYLKFYKIKKYICLIDVLLAIPLIQSIKV